MKNTCGNQCKSCFHRKHNRAISDDSPGNIETLSAPRKTADGVRIRFRVTDADNLHHVQLLIPENHERERNAWGAFRLSSCKQLDGTSSVINLAIHPTLENERVDRVTLQIIDKKGGITWATLLTQW